MIDDRVGDPGLDAELARQVAAEGRIATSLVELERHPGHRLLSTVSPTGATAQRWAAAREALAELWQDFGTYQGVVAAAREVRARRVRPGGQELAELRRLLVEPSIEVSRTAVTLPERRLTGAAERVEKITLEQLSSRMDVAFGQVSELVVTCDGLHQAFLTGLAPLAERVRSARALAADLAAGGPDPDVAAVAALTARIDDLDRACSADPLSLAARPPAEVLAALDTEVTALSNRLVGLAAVRDGWDDQLGELTAAVAEIDTLRGQEKQARQRAQELVADTGLTGPPDRRPALRHRLAGLARPAGWAERALALHGVRTAVGEAVRELRSAHQLAVGLLERRTELRGRFEAYRAKATRLGHAEHPDLLALDEDITRLLWTRPGDLAAATRALAAYQRLLAGPGAAHVSGSGRPA